VANKELTYDIVARTEKMVAAVIAALEKSSKEAKPAGKKIGEELAKGIKESSGLNKVGKDISKALKQNFDKGLDKIGETSLKDLVENTKSTTAKIIENIKRIPSQIGQSLVWVKKNILDFNLNNLIYKDFPEFTKKVFNNFKGFASGAFESLKKLPSALYNLNLNKVFSGLGGFSSAIQGGIKNLGNLGSTIGNVTSQGISGFGSMASSIAGGLGNSLKGASKGIMDLGKNIASTGMDIAKAGLFGGAIAGIGIGGGIAGLGTFGLNLASQIQSTRISLETMLGSAENAKGLMTEITAFAKKTPFNRLGLFDYSKQLIGAGIAQKDMIKTLDKLGNVAAGSGAPLQNIITNYGQIRASNRAYTQDLKQFSNFGIPIWEKLAKNMGITVEALRQGIDSQEIKVNFQEVDQVLKEMTSSGGQYFDLMQKKSGTFEGAVSNLQDTFESLALKFMGVDDTGNIKEGGFFDIAQNKALKFQMWLEANSDQIGNWGSIVFTKIGQGMQLAWTNMVQPVLLDLKDWFDNGGKEAIKKFMQEGWKEIVDGFIYFKDVVYPDAKKKLDEFRAYMASEQGKKDIKDFTDFMRGLWEATKLLAYWSNEAAKGVKFLLDKWNELSNATKIGDSSFSFAGVVANPWVAAAQLLGGKRANGGPVEPGKLYEVGENNKAEMLMMNGRQYMIPGNRGQVLNQNQTDNRQINSGNTNNYYNYSNGGNQFTPTYMT
jgi:tape measure domain-containing protein